MSTARSGTPLKVINFFLLPFESHLRRRLQTNTSGTPTNAAMHAFGASFAVFIMNISRSFQTRLTHASISKPALDRDEQRPHG
jgi:hypothetical protein